MALYRADPGRYLVLAPKPERVEGVLLLKGFAPPRRVREVSRLRDVPKWLRTVFVLTEDEDALQTVEECFEGGQT